MDKESALIQILANRIEEASLVIIKALDENTKARNYCREGRYAEVEPMLLVSHDHLLIAEYALHAIKDYIPLLTQKDEKKRDNEK